MLFKPKEFWWVMAKYLGYLGYLGCKKEIQKSEVSVFLPMHVLHRVRRACHGEACFGVTFELQIKPHGASTPLKISRMQTTKKNGTTSTTLALSSDSHAPHSKERESVPIATRKQQPLVRTTVSHSAPSRSLLVSRAPPSPCHRPSPSPLDPPVLLLFATPATLRTKEKVRLSQSAPVKGVLRSSFREETPDPLEAKTGSPTIYSLLQKERESIRRDARGLRPERQSTDSSKHSFEDLQFRLEESKEGHRDEMTL